MGKKYFIIKHFFFTILFIALIVNSTFAQKPKGNATNVKGTPASKTSVPANTKNIKARGIIAADLDCVVKVNGAAKLVNVKAYTQSVVWLTYGINNIEASPADKKNTASFRTTIDVKDTSKQIVEISFFDDKKFLDYVKEGRADMVDIAIKKNPDLINNEGQILSSAPLQVAIVNSQTSVVKLLVDKGAKYTNMFPLHKAATFASSQKAKGKEDAPDMEIIKFFLKNGCKIDEKDDGGNSLLHAACRGLKLDLVMYLVENGLDINAKNDFGDTPLKIAEAKGGVSIINYLMEHGAKDDQPKEVPEEKKEEDSEDK